MYQRFHVRFQLPAMHRGELSAAITQRMSKCLWSGWKWYKWCKKIVSTFTCCPVNRWYSLKKSLIQKNLKQKKANYPLQHVKTDSGCMWMKNALNFLWRWSLLYRNQSIDLQNKSMNWFLYDKNPRPERVNAFLLECIHWDQGVISLPNPCWDILLDYDKIIDIYAFKYQRRMLLINPLSKK